MMLFFFCLPAGYYCFLVLLLMDTYISVQGCKKISRKAQVYFQLIVHTQCTQNSFSSKPLFYKRRPQTETSKNIQCKTSSQSMLQPSRNKRCALRGLARGLTNHCAKKIICTQNWVHCLNSLCLDYCRCRPGLPVKGHGGGSLHHAAIIGTSANTHITSEQWARTNCANKCG